MATATAPRTGLATVKEAIDFLNCSRTSLYKLIEEGQLKATKIGRMRRVRWDSLHRLIENAEG